MIEARTPSLYTTGMYQTLFVCSVMSNMGNYCWLYVGIIQTLRM